MYSSKLFATLVGDVLSELKIDEAMEKIPKPLAAALQRLACSAIPFLARLKLL
jgi:hypothetical protein